MLRCAADAAGRRADTESVAGARTGECTAHARTPASEATREGAAFVGHATKTARPGLAASEAAGEGATTGPATAESARKRAPTSAAATETAWEGAAAGPTAAEAAWEGTAACPAPTKATWEGAAALVGYAAEAARARNAAAHHAQPAAELAHATRSAGSAGPGCALTYNLRGAARDRQLLVRTNQRPGVPRDVDITLVLDPGEADLHGADLDRLLAGLSAVLLPDANCGVVVLPLHILKGVLKVFLGLLIGLPLAAQVAPRSMLGMVAVFYKTGALVFGGGHVVLPLLRDALIPSGWMSDNTFLSGYGAAQVVPGPLFTFAAYLGAIIAPHGSGLGVAALWSLAALVFIFLPGMLVALAGLPLWNWVGHHSIARGALAGVNAAVVGVLGAALYNPIWTSAILGERDLAVALIAFMLLERWRAPPILIVVFCVGAAVALAGLA